MEFKNIGGHTFAPELLTDGVIIDVGSRDFTFANHFPDKKVYCIDVDPKVFEGVIWNPNFEYLNVGISDKAGETGYYENGEATCLQEIDQDKNHPFLPCKTITMEDLYKITGTNVDILKLDCEGAEYIILGESFKPIPKQCSVEFHKHCVPEMHNDNIDKIMERMAEHYVIYNDSLEPMHGCAPNMWDVLFVRRDLLK